MTLDELTKISEIKFSYEDIESDSMRKYEQYCEEKGDSKIDAIKVRADEAVRSARNLYIG